MSPKCGTWHRGVLLARHATLCHAHIMSTTNPELITSPEAGRMIGRSARTIHRLVESGDLTPVVKLPGPNGALLFRREDIEALAEKRGAA